jgi:hypothetical protein
VASASGKCVYPLTVHQSSLAQISVERVIFCEKSIFKKENKVLIKSVISSVMQGLTVWCLLPAACRFLDWLESGPSKRERLTFIGLLVVISQKMKLSVKAAVRTSNKTISTEIIYVQNIKQIL